MSEQNPKTEQLPDGIYFNLPFDKYLAQDRHSNSRIKKVNDSPLAYWVDEIEPTLAEDYDQATALRESTEAMTEGDAWHKMILEGVDVFNEHYGAAYNPSVNAKAVKSKDEHTKACQANGVAFNKSDTIPKLQERLIEANAPVEFHAILKAEHEARADGKDLLSIEKMNELQIAGKVMEQYKIRETFLSDGFPEVSILFTMDGEKYKIRVDWLSATKQVELKTITVSGQNTKTFEENCADQMHKFSYMPGSYLYTMGVEIARYALVDNLDFARDLQKTQENTEWIDDFIGGGENTRHEYWFLFVQRGKYNHVLPRRFDKYDEALQARRMQAIWKTGKMAVERGVKVYKWYMENNGLEKRWLPPLVSKAWADEDFKPWMIEE